MLFCDCKENSDYLTFKIVLTALKNLVSIGTILFHFNVILSACENSQYTVIACFVHIWLLAQVYFVIHGAPGIDTKFKSMPFFFFSI